MASVLGSQSGETQDLELEESQEEDELYLVGFVQVNVVGLRYYTGTVTDGEMVQLVREPDNPYDGNAIKICNIRGAQVGHIDRHKALHLAPLLDQNLAVMEGIVPNSRGGYKMPCNIYVFSKPASKDLVLDFLHNAGMDVTTPFDEGFAETRAPKAKKKLQPAEQIQKIDSIFDSLMQGCKSRQIMQPSELIVTEMMQHQKEALAWMIHRENSSTLPPFWETVSVRGKKEIMYKNTITNFVTIQQPEPLRGGILADDMGLGKTLSLLALIATNRPGQVLPKVIDISSPIQEETGEGRPSKRRKTTSQSRKTKEGANGSSKSQSAASEELPSFPPRSDGPRATLIVCPLSVLSNWISQLEDHTQQGSLMVHLYHGPDRAKDVKNLGRSDIVLTTYNILSSEGENAASPLRRVSWLRIILDETHLIKNPNAHHTKAVAKLKAERRWAVSGTPIQNGPKDLFSLMVFLQLEPLNDRSFWNRTIQRPLLNGEQSGFLRLQGLVSAIALRRTKDMKVDGRKLIELPAKIVTVYPVVLSSEDRRLYDTVELQGRNMLQRFLTSGVILENYSTVLQIILRLRQICDHSSLCPAQAELLKASTGEGSIELAIASPELLQKLLVQTADEFDCPICLCPPTMAIITRCAHVFCRRCIEKTFTCDKRQCPLCRSPLNSADIFVSNIGEEVEETDNLENGTKASAKIVALISLLQKAREKDPSVKSVVFSQFIQMLNLVQGHLKEAGFNYVRLDGSMSAKKREEAMKAYKSTAPDAPTVFLLSFKAAGVGLNLVSASNVYMLDPWWNPAVEEQAMDRVYRLGQTRDVHVFRLIVADSIEERILKLQERKRQYAQAAFDKVTMEQRRKFCIEEVQLLMHL